MFEPRRLKILQGVKRKVRENTEPHLRYVNMLFSNRWSSNSKIKLPRCLNSPKRYVLKIHFLIESGRKMIQFKIQFKTKSKILIQKIIHSTVSKIFSRSIHSKKWGKLFKISKWGQDMASEPSWGPSIGNRPLKWT